MMLKVSIISFPDVIVKDFYNILTENIYNSDNFLIIVSITND